VTDWVAAASITTEQFHEELQREVAEQLAAKPTARSLDTG
jgi:hypothetical protein